MMRKPTSAVNRTPIRVVLVTMDSHLGGAFARASDTLRRELPNLELVMHAADEWGCTPRSCGRACRNGAAHVSEKWGCNPDAVKAANDDIARADIAIAAMLFLDEHVQAVLPALQARPDSCDAMVGCLSAGEIVRLTRRLPSTCRRKPAAHWPG